MRVYVLIFIRVGFLGDLGLVDGKHFIGEGGESPIRIRVGMKQKSGSYDLRSQTF